MSDATDRYVPEVGDRIRRSFWLPEWWADVLHVHDGKQMLLVDQNGSHFTKSVRETNVDWVKVEKPEPLNRWVMIYADGSLGCGWDTRQEALDQRGMGRRSLLHLWTDDEGNDRSEIEEVDQ